MSPHPFFRSSIALLLASAAFAQINPGNLVVVRVGDGVAALGGTAAPAFLEQYDRTTPGPFLLSTPLPTAVSGLNQPVTLQGSATSEGFITQSVDGKFLLVAGYAALPGAASPNGATSATVNRVIARIDLTGAIDSTTALTDAHNAGSIRSAVSVDGSSFWTSGAGNTLAGTNRGVTYVSALGATTSLSMTAALTNGRVATIYNGQLYVSTASSGFVGVNTVGTGLPTTSGQTAALLTGFSAPSGVGTASQYDFWFADAQTCYVADDRTVANGGGIQKWTESAGTWTLQYTLSPGAGCRGLSGIKDLGGTQLYATTAVASANALVTVTDTGAGSTFTTLATAPTNTAFRGVRFVRQPSSVTISGTPCATVAGIPTVGTAGGPPVSGNANFGLTIGNGAAGLPYITVISINAFVGPGFPLSFIGGPPCALLYTPAFDILLSGNLDGLGNGLTPLPLGIPDASLWGLDLAVQHLLLDPLYLAFDLPFATTEALQIEIGS